MSADPVSRPWRRFLRFSVRGLIALVVVVGIWLGWVVHLAHIQRDAVAAIQNARGLVGYDWEWNKWRKGISARGKPPAPRWFMNLVGVDYFGHITRAALSGATDANTVMVGRLTRLEVLYLKQSAVSDIGLAQLKRLTELTHLDLSGTQVSDAGLAHLKGLTKLSYLNLSFTQVTDAEVKDLQQALPSLTIMR